ncbi:hypothetical protein KAR91_84925 [Candidatus Pacearchaeota archaeon]|nr:hypothetical protein [Candidatus Pacearchaeota archaeon]
MRIHNDHNGVAVNSISILADGTNVEGHQYEIISGSAIINTFSINSKQRHYQRGSAGHFGASNWGS